jgi:hypothetical protein
VREARLDLREEQYGSRNKDFEALKYLIGQSQWPRGLRHEKSSPAGTLGSLVRIPLEALMSVCICSVFVLFCV